MEKALRFCHTIKGRISFSRGPKETSIISWMSEKPRSHALVQVINSAKNASTGKGAKDFGGDGMNELLILFSQGVFYGVIGAIIYLVVNRILK